MSSPVLWSSGPGALWESSESVLWQYAATDQVELSQPVAGAPVRSRSASRIEGSRSAGTPIRSLDVGAPRP